MSLKNTNTATYPGHFKHLSEKKYNPTNILEHATSTTIKHSSEKKTIRQNLGTRDVYHDQTLVRKNMISPKSWNTRRSTTIKHFPWILSVQYVRKNSTELWIVILCENCELLSFWYSFLHNFIKDQTLLAFTSQSLVFLSTCLKKPLATHFIL